jgi:methyl-accepting chemotaxis protein
MEVSSNVGRAAEGTNQVASSVRDAVEGASSIAASIGDLALESRKIAEHSTEVSTIASATGESVEKVTEANQQSITGFGKIEQSADALKVMAEKLIEALEEFVV